MSDILDLRNLAYRQNLWPFPVGTYTPHSNLVSLIKSSNKSILADKKYNVKSKKKYKSSNFSISVYKKTNFMDSYPTDL